MRQSLSDIADRKSFSTSRQPRAAFRAATTAVGAAIVLIGATAVDQLLVHSLDAHLTDLYAPYDKTADPGPLYGLLYAVGLVSASSWALELRVLRRSRRVAALVATVVIMIITGSAGALVLTVAEYGRTIFPPLWGVLAVLPPAAGLVTLILLATRAR